MIVAYVGQEGILDLHSFSEKFLDIRHLTSLESFLQFFESIKHRAVALIYQINDEEDLNKLNEHPFITNIFLVVIGPSDTSMALLAGQMGADIYIPQEEIDEASLTKILYEGQKKLKKRRGESHITAFTGIHGGAGTTTVALNSALFLANNDQHNRVLFIDVSYTKGITNLFFENPNPKSTIITILNKEFSDFQSIIENGIYQYQNNLYYVPGIQLHTDREELEKPENIQKMIQFINDAKEYFSHIIIDTGVFADVNLAIDLQEVADTIIAITELTLPTLSILMTYLMITERSGWRSKIKILANRYDAKGSLEIKRAQRILNKNSNKSYTISYTLPNDWLTLHQSWNNLEIAALHYPNCDYIKKLSLVIDDLFYFQKESSHKNRFKRFFQWA